MDIDRKKQWVADALGMTLAEVEDMGKIEWKPIEHPGFIDPRKYGRCESTSWLRSMKALIDYENDYWDARYQSLVTRMAISILREDGHDGEKATIPENGQPVENYSNTSTK